MTVRKVLRLTQLGLGAAILGVAVGSLCLSLFGIESSATTELASGALGSAAVIGAKILHLA